MRGVKLYSCQCASTGLSAAPQMSTDSSRAWPMPGLPPCSGHRIASDQAVQYLKVQNKASLQVKSYFSLYLYDYVNWD